MWIGGGGSGGSGEYDCAHQTALYNTRNKKCLPESPLTLSVLFFRGHGSQGWQGALTGCSLVEVGFSTCIGVIGPQVSMWCCVWIHMGVVVHCVLCW